MKQSDIAAGVTYHNGLKGNRSYSSREVLEVFNKFGFTDYYVEYLQVAGRYKGEKAHLSLQSFAQWAKGTVEHDN